VSAPDAAVRQHGPSATLGQVRAALVSRAGIETYCVLLGFFGLAVVLTWPVIIHPGSIISGGGGGDQAGYVWDYWYAARYGTRFWGSGVQDMIGAPFGREYSGAINATLLVALAPAWIATKAVSAVAAYNVVALSGLTFSGAGMYLLVRWLRLGYAAAIWAGAIFMIFPYEQIRSSGHQSLAHLECFPILLMAGLWWMERPSWRRAAALAGGLAFCWVSNPYYGLMGSVVAAVLVLAGTVRASRMGGLRRAAMRLGEAVGAIAVLVGLPLIALLASSEGTIDATFERNRDELALYGARVTDFVLPPDTGLWRELMGTFSWANPGGERTNFIGWTVILLAIAGLALGWRMRRELATRLRLLLAVGPPLGLVLIWFSLATPTKWFGAEISMPSGLIFDYFPYLRVYARFVAPLMCVVLAMAAVGLWLLMRNRSITTRLSVLSVAAILSVVDLAPTVPLASAQPILIDGRAPEDIPIWRWLRGHDPGAIVYETPGYPDEWLERHYTSGQIVHHHPLTNGTIVRGQLATDFQLETADPGFPGTPGRLASVGISLVTSEPWGYGILGLPPRDARRPPPGFVLVRSFPDGSAVWRVATAPDDAVAVRRDDGWWAPEFTGGQLWRWMDDDARTTIVARRAGTYRVTFQASSYVPNEVHTLDIGSPDGFVDKIRVGGTRVYSAVVHVPAGRSDIQVHNEGPPARQPNALDKRMISVRMSAWTVRRLGP
jgi:hypothetical protein